MPKNFAPNANTYAPGNVPLASSVVDPVQTLSADGAITLLSGLVVITKTSAAAVTLAVPDQDGQRVSIISTTAFAHTITTPAPGFNNVSAFTVITLANSAYDTVFLESQGGVWWVIKPSAHANTYQSTQVMSADGAVSIKNGLVIITKGTALAGTLADPTTGVDDGAYLEIVSTTNVAHVITAGTSGYNAKGSSGTATYGLAKGNAFSIVAYQGKWYTTSLLGVTIA